MMEDVCKIMPKTVTFYGVHSNIMMVISAKLGTKITHNIIHNIQAHHDYMLCFSPGD